MTGKKGRSGVGPKSPEHRAKIAASLKEFWDGPDGQALRLRRRETKRARRNARVEEVFGDGRTSA